MSESRRQLLSIGVFFIILVVGILLIATKALAWAQGLQLVIVLFGVWFLALAVMRGGNPLKYERSSFSTIAMGTALVVIGGAWYLFAFGWLYSLALLLLACGAIAIAAALRRTK